MNNFNIVFYGVSQLNQFQHPTEYPVATRVAMVVEAEV